MRIPFILLFLIYGLTPLAGDKLPGREVKKIYFSGRAQGTTYHITYYDADTLVSQKQIDSMLDILDNSLSIYNRNSLISRFNRALFSVRLDNHLLTVVRRSLEIYKDSKGVSDISIYPLMKIWGFGPDPGPGNPDAQTIRSARRCVGSDKIRLRGNRLIKDLPCVKIDVNGIAQGYSVDVIADFLGNRGIKNYLVEIGGELRIHGRKQPGDETMTVGIESPATNELSPESIQQVISIKEGALTTSGNYRNFHKQNGKTFSHLMDPKTGYPFQNELISVTVWAAKAMNADGYDNVLMGLGLKKALHFLMSRPQMQAYFIYRDKNGRVADTASSGFYKFFVPQGGQINTGTSAGKN